MKTSIKTALLSVAATSALMISASAFAADKADFDKAYAAAEASVKQAAAMKNEWRDTGKIMKAAKEAAAAGDFAKAITLAQSAEFQGQAAQAQASAETNAGNPGYLYN